MEKYKKKHILSSFSKEFLSFLTLNFSLEERMDNKIKYSTLDSEL
jgi:hypothetical protein